MSWCQGSQPHVLKALSDQLQWRESPWYIVKVSNGPDFQVGDYIRAALTLTIRKPYDKISWGCDGWSSPSIQVSMDIFEIGMTRQQIRAVFEAVIAAVDVVLYLFAADSLR